MKLSKAQAKIIEDAHRDIDRARAMTYPEWLKEANSFYQAPSEYARKCYEEAVKREELKGYWEREKNGIVLTHCNSKSLYKLESLGLIEIVVDSKGESYGLDWIKVLNY